MPDIAKLSAQSSSDSAGSEGSAVSNHVSYRQSMIDAKPKLLDIDPDKPTKELEWTILALFRLCV
jgi:hypothetical protein